jgi:hypothetical protein
LNIEKQDGGFRFSEGCQRLKYDLVVPYPGSGTIKFISEALLRQGWSRVTSPGMLPREALGHAKKVGIWEHWNNVGGSTTYLRTDLWQDRTGDVVRYTFWYFPPAVKKLQVEASYCSAAFVDKHRCFPDKPFAHDASAYSVAMTITKVEPVNADFKVFVEIENNGEKPVQLGVNGALSDGSPELWVLGIQQQDVGGEWSSVDAVCPEHPPFDWITLKPGEKIDSWALAVEFPGGDSENGQ